MMIKNGALQTAKDLSLSLQLLAILCLLALGNVPMQALAHGGGSHSDSELGPETEAEPDALQKQRKALLLSQQEQAKFSAEMHDALMRTTQDLHMMPRSDKPERDFAKLMIEQNQRAISFAELGVKHSTDPSLREMASKTIEARKKEIEAIRSWLSQTSGSVVGR